MKLVYIFQNNLNKNTAEVYQSLQMANAFSELTQITVLTSRISKANLEKIKVKNRISKNVKFVSFPIKFYDSNLFLEFYSRFIYNLLAFLYLKLHKNCVVYTRDLSFLYFETKIPSWLRIQSKVYYEPHKIYHVASEKVSKSTEIQSLKIPDYFFPITEGIKEELAQIFYIPFNKMKIAPSGFNFEHFNSIKKDTSAFLEMFPTATDKFVAVYTGSFLEWKGIDVLLKAISLIKDQQIYFIIIGGSIGDLKKYRKTIDKLGIEEHVHIGGVLELSTIINVLRCSNVGIIPNNNSVMSNYTSPLKIFEYMAVGLPIIASDLKVFKEILIENENSIFFETGNAKDLAEKIKFLKIQVELCKKISEANLKKSAFYTWKERARAIVETINVH